MNIKWTKGASQNLYHIEEFVVQDNPKAAKDVVLKIIRSVELLKNNPAMGKVGRIFDTRELVIAGTPFIVPYRIKHEQIEVLRILHSSMQWPHFL